MIKRAFKNIVGLLSCSLLLTCCDILSYDNPNFKIYEDGYFQYIHTCDNSKNQDKNDKSLVIVGFTESGKQQETLDIPSKINGYEVKRIGIFDEGYPSGNHSRYVICSAKLKKLYIPNSISIIQCFDGKDVSLMICDDHTDLNYSFSNADYKDIYLCSKRYKELNIQSNNIFSANVNFDLNYQAEGLSKLYRIDNVENDEKITIPPKPVRDGYSFTGWYTEPESTNIWDFNNPPTIEANSEMVLYAGWENK